MQLCEANAIARFRGFAFTLRDGVMTQALPDLPESVLPGPLLIVEDDALTQRRLSTILTGLGYQAEALQFAGDIAAARALLAE